MTVDLSEQNKKSKLEKSIKKVSNKMKLQTNFFW
jgi:hypothetical protein